jgi:uncharacterized repeat protein (TIGR03803 family)
LKSLAGAAALALGLTISAHAATPTYQLLKTFNGGDEPGTSPYGDLIKGSDGALYGTASEGGTHGAGTVYRLNPDGTGFTVLHHFARGTDGSFPQAGLIQGTDGALYGTARVGGPNGAGTVYKLNTNGIGFTVLKHFDEPTTGGFPRAGLIQGTDGALYGTAGLGGTYGDGLDGFGTVYKLNPNGTGFTVLKHFDGSTNGSRPLAGLIQGTDGALYGTASRGGAANIGTVFKLNPDGTGFTVLKHFATPTTGGLPFAGLIQGTDGALYGTTVLGGTNGLSFFGGTVFRLNPDGTDFTVLMHFGPFTTDCFLLAGLIQGTDGALYGTTFFGGNNASGTVFRIMLEDVTPPVLTCLPDLVVVSDRSACAVGDHDDNDWAHHSREGRQRDEGENHGGCLNNRGGDDNDSHGYTCRFWNRCRATGVVLEAPVATDNCSVASVVNDHPSTTYPLGVTWVTWTATDGSGNFSTCVQKVTVVAAVEISFRTPVVRKPTSNTIRRGQVVPFVVELASCLAQTVRSGVTVTLQVQGIVSSTGVVFQDVVEDASGMGTDGTLTSNGLMQLRDSQWKFKLDTGNFGDANTIAGDRFYRATVIVKDNATGAVVGMGSVNMETGRK